MDRFNRFKKIITEDDFANIERKSVLIIGVGGVGGYVAESLARSGIGRIVIIDHDIIDKTNINRQIIALNSTIGRVKVDVLKERIIDINPKCEVIAIKDFIDFNNINSLLKYNPDFIVDACDTIQTKKEIIKLSLSNSVNFISCMGTGNKFDPNKLEITKLEKTINDPLARILRKWVKDERIKGKITVLSSKEIPKKTGDRTPGSTSFVPPCAGLLIASHIINSFIKEKADI